MNYYALFYEVVDEFVTRRAPYRAEHLRLAEEAHRRGDLLLGWTRVAGPDGVERDYYVRQMWDWKTSADLETMDHLGMGVYARMCGWTLARAHARSGKRHAIAAYLGSGTSFERAMQGWAASYADQNERDYRALLAAIADGRVTRSHLETPAAGQGAAKG